MTKCKNRPLSFSRHAASRLAILVVLGAWVGCGANALAESGNPPLLQADKISYDENTQIVIAVGHVELAQTDQVLRADKMIYNKKTDVVRAEGNVAITSQKTGEILYSKQIEVTSDMKEAFLDNIGMLFPDQSRLAAQNAERFQGRYLIAENGVYSACSLCADDPKAPPLWQMRAARITHDEQEKNVIYRDATIEFWGKPVFYTPYFSHPDPTVKRRQGFLAPTTGADGNLGMMVRTPYYFDLAPNSDLLLTPTFSAIDKMQIAAIWRHRFSNARMMWNGSFTYTDFVNDSGVDKGDRWRGHLFGNADIDIDDYWRAGAKIALTSDKSYLPRYKISSDDLLVNRLFAERFEGRQYFVGESYYFKDMRPGTRLVEPLVAPEMRYSALGEPGQTWGGRWSFDTGLLVTTRDNETAVTQQGANTRRFSVNTGWERQFVASTGFLTNLSAKARADAYWADHVPDPNQTLGSSFSDVARTRTFAQSDLAVRYPLGRHGDGYQQILEPIAVVSLAPRVKNSTILPNEDSLDVEFDETNLFASNRYSGIDRIEGGNRVAYGLRHGLYGENGEKLDIIAGQIFRPNRDESFSEGSGLRERFSDYVGRINLSTGSWLDMGYSFRLDQQNLNLTRQQANMAAGVPAFKPFANYMSLRQSEDTVTTDQKVEEATAGFNSTFYQFWSFSASHKQAINPSPGPRISSFKLGYKDECFTSSLLVQKDYTSRSDVKSGVRVLLNIYLKNIGGFDTEN